MTTLETPAYPRLAFRQVVGRHRRPEPRWLYLLRLVAVGAAVYVGEAYVVGPFLVSLIGWPATALVVLAAIVMLLRRR